MIFVIISLQYSQYIPKSVLTPIGFSDTVSEWFEFNKTKLYLVGNFAKFWALQNFYPEDTTYGIAQPISRKYSMIYMNDINSECT